MLVVVAVASLALVLGCGAILLRRLRTAASSLERTTREANESATRLKVLVEHVPAAVYIDMADPDVSDGGRLAYMSPQIAGILGYGPDELIDDPELWPSRIHPDDRAAAIAAYDAHWRTGEPLRAEYRMLARDGSEVWVRDEAFAMADDTRSGQRVSQGLLVDTTDRKRLESRLIHDALHDPLTGLANRVLLRDHLERALARQGREPGRVALLFVDLDDFKRVNDTFGHAAGDEILCRVAERLARAVREGDVVGRQSGDEFAVLLVNVVAEEEASAAARADPRRAAPPDPARRAVDRRRRLDRHRRRDAPRAAARRAAPPRRTCSSAPMPRCTRPRPSARARSRTSTRGCRSAPGRSSKPRVDTLVGCRGAPRQEGSGGRAGDRHRRAGSLAQPSQTFAVRWRWSVVVVPRARRQRPPSIRPSSPTRFGHRRSRALRPCRAAMGAPLPTPSTICDFSSSPTFAYGLAVVAAIPAILVIGLLGRRVRASTQRDLGDRALGGPCSSPASRRGWSTGPPRCVRRKRGRRVQPGIGGDRAGHRRDSEGARES